ncbi:putative cobalamin biosynthesis protein [Rhizobium phage RHEph10]|uniref:putative cobalamin biosynthesis protein n=1 Tax=Rhizobium phage RHEph10 TaxID=1220717 RepID=UPI0002AB4D75|nr:putative cobalamin biosynthesis protein [Rhizobium phage RHEph10]AGC36087.1 putative cobalamin biosynthesis protein [Rhizobium phage RHEph10]
MNNDIVILREAIKKIVPMLAGKGLTVTQMGTQAYVQPHPVTGLPWRVNIPLLPDNAEPEFVFAIQGFIDHEVAHVLFTDFLFKARDKSKRLHNLHNIVEDTMIERLMSNEFPGSKRNISKLREYFLRNVTAAAIAKARSKEEEFGYLVVVLMRALAGHVEFQEFMDDNNYWEHELVKPFMQRFPKASQDKMPLLQTTEQTYDIAVEIEAILYPPPPPAPPQPPEPEEQDDQDQGEGSDDQEPSEGEDDKDHSDEQQTGDGEGDGEREHTEDNDDASGGEGESEEEKDDDAGDGEDEGSGAGEEKADDEEGDDVAPGTSADDGDDDSADKEDASDEDSDGSAGEQDDADDEPQTGKSSSSPKEDGDDDADDQGGSGNGDDDEHDQGEEGSDEHADAGQEAADSDAEGEDQPAEMEDGADESGEADQSDDGESGSDAGGSGSDDQSEEDGEDDEAGGNPLNNVAIEDAGSDEDGEDGEPAEDDDTPSVELAGIGYDPNQNPFSAMSDDELDEKDISSALVKIIVKEAISACRAADYSVFTRDYDIIKPLEVPENFSSKYIVELEEQTRALTGVMQKDIERMMAAQARVFNVAGQRSGRLNSAGLHRLTAGDARVFSRREEIRAKDTAVALLSDCSGSMKGRPMATALSAAYALASVLERCNIPSECMGFTTAQSYGSGSVMSEDRVRQFSADLMNETQKSGVRFSRTVPIYMPIFKDFNERINADVKKRFAYQRKNQPFMGANVDGESLEYAAMRLARRKEKRKVIIVLSDGFPAGARNDDEHLKYMVERLTGMGYDLVGIGIESDAVERFYDNHIVLQSVDELPRAVMGELKKILMK